MAELSYLPKSAADSETALAFTEQREPGYTFKLDTERQRVRGTTDDKDALLQAIYLMLSVERYAYPIYSRNYGVELGDLIGKPKDYAMSEIKRRITEALTQDDRITGVTDWEFEQIKRKSVTVRFVVNTVYGDLLAEKEVDI